MIQLNNFAVAFFTPPMFKAWEWGTYIFFAIFLAAGMVWIFFFLPETKGATMEDMDRIFKSHTGEEDAILLAEARRDVGLGQELEDHALIKAKQMDDEENGYLAEQMAHVEVSHAPNSGR